MKELKQLTQYKTTCQTHNQDDSVLIRVQQQLLALGVTVRGNGLRIPLNDKRDRSKAAEELFGGRNEVHNISLADEDGFPWISLQIPNMILKVGLVLVEA